jgi:hypothetical protein
MIMKKLRNSLMVLVGFTALIGLIAVVTPMAGKGQGNNSAPTRNVNVVNPATDPVLVRDVGSGREPFQETTPFLIQIGDNDIQEIVFAVPAGKRCVIETVSAHIGTRSSGDTPSGVNVSTRLTPSGFFGIHHIAVSRQGLSVLGFPVFAGTHYMRAYAGPGTSVSISVSHNDTSESLTGSITITGYFEDVP